MRCEVAHKDVLRLFEPFKDDPLVRLVSLMDHTPGQRQIVNLDKLRVYYQGKHALSDAEFERMIVDSQAAQELSSYQHRDRKSDVSGKSVEVRGETGGRGIIQQKIKQEY